MSVSDKRLAAYTDALLKEYIQDGTLPDEVIIERALSSKYADYYNPATGNFDINRPLWEQHPITYRSISDYTVWNTIQNEASEDFDILYSECLQDAKLLTDKLYEYSTKASMMRRRLARLVNRIENLLLLGSDTAGFLDSFYDTFIDDQYISRDLPTITTALVNIDKQLVELPEDTSSEVDGAVETSSILNLIAIKESDIRMAVQNNVASVVSISNASVTDIFNNKATAWQKEFILSDSGPLKLELTVRVSPLEPISINRIEISTKMPDATNQVLVQAQYSPDGISYYDVPAVTNPQYTRGDIQFVFRAIWASHFKFYFTKTVPDHDNSYYMGIQYINFIEMKYASNAILFSTPITRPSSLAINRVACEVCENCPQGTDIDYFVGYPTGSGSEYVFTPISHTADDNPEYAKIIDVSHLSVIDTIIDHSDWHINGSGKLELNLQDFATEGFDGSDPNILESIILYRGIGPDIAQGSAPNSSLGYDADYSAFSSGAFTTYIEVNNPDGVTWDLGTTTLSVDDRLCTGHTNISEGMHKIVTPRLDIHQETIASGCDIYFGYKQQLKSYYDFDNNVSSEDVRYYTYESASGTITINPIPTQSGIIEVDNKLSFEYANDQYSSSINAIPIGAVASTTLNATLNNGLIVTLTNGNWVNEIHLDIATNFTNNIIRIERTYDGINWETISDDTAVLQAGNSVAGYIKFDAPFYATKIRVSLKSGSNLTVAANGITLYGPVFITTQTIVSKPIMQEYGNTWGKIIDPWDGSQSVGIVSDFNGTVLDSIGPTPTGINISNIIVPKIRLNIYNANIAPYLDPMSITGIPLTEEQIYLYCKYVKQQDANALNHIIFKAILYGNEEDSSVTPELLSYRVKMS